MKTKEDMIKEGYPEDWSVKCDNCGSYDCHAYTDCILCFECKNRIIIKNKEENEKKELIINKQENYNKNWKLSGNKKFQKRYFPGLR